MAVCKASVKRSRLRQQRMLPSPAWQRAAKAATLSLLAAISARMAGVVRA
jgi:hypothetical protein